ncbi:M18 family aminopeptidase [Methylotenera mobilis]|uniref:M18 family aminopeptidase n=1 Tax=Methylotenera mobilis (strain JLW8 / ATCC BAA-1282 / DSM 17540) TaxID=583345 RepID=C6WTI8_METML|nr:M18 family aminopeptidase [Methylotenera mobilis]ACT47310.1 Aspartyl aminopeptidase [Methylotenera mobilis JLW8]
MNTPTPANISAQARTLAKDLLNFIDLSPSPWHAVEQIEQQLLGAGFTQLDETQAWQLAAGKRYFVVRGGASIIAFTLGNQPLADTGFRMVGAHTDSPSLRLKPKAAYETDGLLRIGVEVYGGPILATFTDRDLSIAGRVTVRTASGHAIKLLKFDDALMRLPNLAIHMNREVNEKGLKLNKQTELPLLFGESAAGIEAEQQFLAYVATALNIAPQDILTFEFNVFDTQKGKFWGANQEFITNSQLDNLASCHAAITALLNSSNQDGSNICALFDHEEVGSESATGASGSFLADVITRITSNMGMNEEERLRALAQSFFVSADMAHAYHPNHASAYEPCHHVMVNQGPVIKTNANQRYASNADTAARFIALCERAQVPFQQYSHRTDLGCGSTIGPILASGLGVASVDVGSPMWAMHSIRESAGVLDHHYMIAALGALFTS